MRLIIQKETSIDEMIEILSDFLKDGYSEYSIAKSTNIYLTLKDSDNQLCPDNEKEFILSAEGHHEKMVDDIVLKTAEIVDVALDASGTEDEFIQELEKYGYKVRMSAKAKTITFIDPDGKRIRNGRLINITRNDCNTEAILKRLKITNEQQKAVRYFNTLDGISQFCKDNNIAEQGQRVVYVLSLEDGFYYVGQTGEFQRRMKRHFAGSYGGSLFGKEHVPVSVHEVINVSHVNESICTIYETAKTIAYMERYGIDKVRGGDFCKLDNTEIIRLLKTHGYVVKDGKCIPGTSKAGKYADAIEEMKSFPVLYREH